MSRLRLREVRLSGFKTFADKTTIAFTPGITAIVGPNGSGKSNIVDAIRWTMGMTVTPSMCRFLWARVWWMSWTMRWSLLLQIL